MISVSEFPVAGVRWYVGTRVVYTGDAADQTFVRLGYCYEPGSSRILAVEPAWSDDVSLGQSLTITAVWQTLLEDNPRRPLAVFVPTDEFARGALDSLGDDVAVELFSGAPPGDFRRAIHKLSRKPVLPIRPYRGRLLSPAWQEQEHRGALGSPRRNSNSV